MTQEELINKIKQLESRVTQLEQKTNMLSVSYCNPNQGFPPQSISIDTFTSNKSILKDIVKKRGE